VPASGAEADAGADAEGDVGQPKAADCAWCFMPQQAAPARGIRLIGDENTGFQELTAACFLHPDPGAPGWTLCIDDEPQPTAVTAFGPGWCWTPGFFAGEVTAELIAPDGRVACRCLLDVAPSPTKLGRDAFAAMVQALWAFDPELVLGAEPSTRAVGRDGDRQSLLLRLARLRRHAPAAIAALRQVQRSPLKRLRAERERHPPHRVRRIDRLTASTLAQQPALAVALCGDQCGNQSGEPLGGGAGSLLPPADPVLDPGRRLDVPASEPTLDCAPNRTLLAVALRLLGELKAVRRGLAAQAAAEQASATRTPLASRAPRRQAVLLALEQALAELLGRSPFSAVSRPEITAAGLTAIAAHPGYAAAHRQSWRACARGLDGPPTEERLWISPTWEVFERWCLVRLAEALLDAGHAPVAGHDRDLPHAERTLCYQDADGARTTLLLQPTFPAWDQARGAAVSLSGLRIPDLVLIRDDAAGRRWQVLDAKYRSARSALLDAMTSAHLYHDCLRLNDAPPSRALLLVPACHGAGWLLEPEFHRRHGVGALCVTGDDDAAFRALIGAH
jgi:hypothetical protein